MSKDFLKDSVPKLREDLEMIPLFHQNQRAVLIRDILGLIRHPVIIQGDALHLLKLIDGKRTAAEIQLELVRMKRGILVSFAAMKFVSA